MIGADQPDDITRRETCGPNIDAIVAATVSAIMAFVGADGSGLAAQAYAFDRIAAVARR